ncbi:MAG: dTDP-4-dehydrorhamnose 3,5-epimerase family protein [Lachnospiraceae bacterium]
MGRILGEKNVGGIEGLCHHQAIHGDARGYFVETYSKNDMKEAGLTMEFVRDNPVRLPRRECAARPAFPEAVPAE